MKRTWKGMLLVLAVCSAILYAQANIILMMLVVYVQWVSLDITVIDSESNAALEGVDVLWLETNPTTDVQWTTPFGVTDAGGKMKGSITVQETPLWLVPPLGRMRFNDRTLRLTKAGYEPLTVQLYHVAPATRYGTKAVSVTIALDKLAESGR
jgi:hypothetical protein